MNELRAIFDAARVDGRRALDESTGKRVLAAYGIAVPRSRLIRATDDWGPALASLQAPYVLKLVSPEGLHKTDVGGVALGLADERAVTEALREMQQRVLERGLRIDGFLLEEMVAPGIEVVVGATQDASFGPVVMFGLGGVLVEVIRDVAFRICPIDARDARQMIHELKGAPLLLGARGRAPVNEEALVRALLAIGGERGLVMDLADEIAELDVNPLIASADGVVAVDARMILKRTVGA